LKNSNIATPNPVKQKTLPTGSQNRFGWLQRVTTFFEADPQDRIAYPNEAVTFRNDRRIAAAPQSQIS
jgi:hypothetical protein